MPVKYESMKHEQLNHKDIRLLIKKHEEQKPHDHPSVCRKQDHDIVQRLFIALFYNNEYT